MPRQLPWTNTLSTKFGAVAVVLLALAAALIVGNTLVLSAMRGDSRKMNLFAAGATCDYRLLFNAERLALSGSDSTVRSRSEAALRETIAAMDARFAALLLGDAAQGIPAVDEPPVRTGLEHAAEEWRADRKPKLERFLAATAREERTRLIETFREPLGSDAREFTRAARLEQEYLQDEVDRGHALQLVFLGAATIVLLFVVLLTTSSR